MKSRHVAALVIGCLLALPGIGMLLGGAGLAAVYAWGRDDGGYYTMTLRTVQTTTVAVTAEDVVVDYGPAPERWIAEQFAVDVRLRVTPTDSGQAIFAGVAEQGDVATYLAGTAHDSITRIDRGAPHYTRVSGDDEIAPPTGQTFWTAQTSGTGTQLLDWELTGGNWAIVLMNADGSPGVSTAVQMGARADFILPLALTLLGIGLVVTGVAAALIGYAVARRQAAGAPYAPTGAVASAGAGAALVRSPGTPVVLTAQLDPQLSRAMWLVKWFLAIPHFILLAFAWSAFGVLTIIAWFAILFTGRYPRPLFDFNVGVMRWTWRVSYYAGEGGLGSDRYPAFSLDPVPEDLATLDIAYPERLSRGLIFVKWFLAIPHLLITGLLIGSGWRWTQEIGEQWETDYGGFGILGLLVGIAALVLLFTGSYQHGLFDLIIGLNRWVFRVGAYVALMTDEYPPFRLDMGGTEGLVPPGPPGVAPPTVAPDAVPEAVGGSVPAAPPPHGVPVSQAPPPDDR